MKKSLKIFISSTAKDLDSEREMTARTIESLKLEAVRAVTYPSNVETPADTRKALVRECDVFIGIYGGRYGFVPPGHSVSVTEMEFLEARQAKKDILIYIRDEIDRDPMQASFLRRADDFEGGYFRRPGFRTTTELAEWIKQDLIALLSSRFVTSTQPEERTTADAYRSYVRSLYGEMSFAGLAQTTQGLAMPLLEVFVGPRFLAMGQQNRISSDPLDLDQVLSLTPRCLIVGDPGSGKTTLLKALAVQAAQGLRRAHDGEGILPILVPLASWAPTIERSIPRENLEHYIADFLTSRAQPEFVPAIQKALKSGRAMVLLDGLDEVDSADLRMAIGNEVSAFSDRYPGVAVVVTSRSVGAVRIPGFTSYEVLPWTNQQISDFLVRWSCALNAALDLSSDPETQANELLHAVTSHVGLNELARNPLLLTILAFLHRQAYRLPTRRIELYDAAARTLLGPWDRARSLSHTLPRRFDSAKVERILSALALEMSIRDLNVVGVDDAITIASVATPPDQSVDLDLANFFRDLADHASVFREVGPLRFAFVHRAFQEFFAAKAVAAMPDEEVVRFISSHYFEPRFEETIRLALSSMDAYGGRRELVGRVVEELLSVGRA